MLLKRKKKNKTFTNYKMSNVHFRFLDKEYFNNWRQLYYSVDYEDIIKDELWSDFDIQWDMVEYTDSIIDDNNYVLCALYGGSTPDTFSDFQYGITESFKVKSNKNKSIPEDDISAFYRSIGEELGLHYNSTTPIMCYEKSKNLKINVTNITNTKLNTYSKRLDYRQDFRYNRKKVKMGTIIHGTETEIKKYLNAPNLFLDKSEDTIVGIVAVKFEDIKAFFKSTTKPSFYKSKANRCSKRYFSRR